MKLKGTSPVSRQSTYLFNLYLSQKNRKNAPLVALRLEEACSKFGLNWTTVACIGAFNSKWYSNRIYNTYGVSCVELDPEKQIEEAVEQIARETVESLVPKESDRNAIDKIYNDFLKFVDHMGGVSDLPTPDVPENPLPPKPPEPPVEEQPTPSEPAPEVDSKPDIGKIVKVLSAIWNVVGRWLPIPAFLKTILDLIFKLFR